MERDEENEKAKERHRHVWQLHCLPTALPFVSLWESKWVWVCLLLRVWCLFDVTFQLSLKLLIKKIAVTLSSFAFTFLLKLSPYIVFCPKSFSRLPFRCETALARFGLTQTARSVKHPSPNYSHPPAWLPSAPSLLHKYTQTLKCLILCGSPPYNHMSLQFSGRAKSSIIALTYAPLVKGEQHVKCLTLQFFAYFGPF